ncbi:MAG: PfkB family carbohydrate kinase [Bryobacteraceae bacterium]
MNAAEILRRFRDLRVLVVGDVCLDRWCRYDPREGLPSRETGLPRVGVVSTVVTAGAGGTIANNLAALGAGRVAVLGVVGEDGFGFELSRALGERGISTDFLIRSSEVPTFTYTKLINSATDEEDLPRIDFIHTREISEALESRVLDLLKEAAQDFDIVIVSDQAETAAGGVVSARVREALTPIAQQKVVWVDSRVRAEHFRGVILKPNRDEAEAASSRALGRVDFSALRAHTEARLLIVTRGGEGALVLDEHGESMVAARTVEKPVDICGAGDSFSAGGAMTLAVTGSGVEAARFGNLVASITIMKKGTGTASPEEVLAAYEYSGD